jgi:hypothetical protein
MMQILEEKIDDLLENENHITKVTLAQVVIA